MVKDWTFLNNEGDVITIHQRADDGTELILPHISGTTGQPITWTLISHGLSEKAYWPKTLSKRSLYRS